MVNYAVRTVPGFLDVNTLMKVVFNYLMRYRGGESLVAMDLIILKRRGGAGKADELVNM